MRSRSLGALACLALLVAASGRPAAAADPPKRKPLTKDERAAVLTLIKAVDLAQETAPASEDDGWETHILKSTNYTAYLPFRLAVDDIAWKGAVVYIRAVSRRDGVRARDERSQAVGWLANGAIVPPRIQTVYVGSGELPVGGPAAGSSRRATSGPAEAFAVLALQQREAERQLAAEKAAATKKTEVPERDPLLFPFEDFYVVDLKAKRDGETRTLDRALALPPGEYDVFVAMIDRGRLKTSGATIVDHVVTVPDFWNDQLALSTLILASDVKTLPAPLPPQQQVEHPFTFGRAEVMPLAAPVYAVGDVLSVVYQICNYGAPDSDLSAEYNFFRLDNGARRLFNRTLPQTFGDEDLPPPSPWETQAFATQAVALDTFPPGRYELEVKVHDRLTRATASRSVTFTVAPR